MSYPPLINLYELTSLNTNYCNKKMFDASQADGYLSWKKESNSIYFRNSNYFMFSNNLSLAEKNTLS